MRPLAEATRHGRVKIHYADGAMSVSVAEARSILRRRRRLGIDGADALAAAIDQAEQVSSPMRMETAG